MQGRWFRSAMLAMAILLVLTGSISAGTKPPEPTELTVANWDSHYDTNPETLITTVTYLAAENISWPGKGKRLALGYAGFKLKDLDGDGAFEPGEQVAQFKVVLVRVETKSPCALLEASTSITLVDPLADEACYFVPYVEVLKNNDESLDNAQWYGNPLMGKCLDPLP